MAVLPNLLSLRLLLLLKIFSNEFEFGVSVLWIYELHQSIEDFEVSEFLLLEFREKSIHFLRNCTSWQPCKDFVRNTGFRWKSRSDARRNTVQSLLFLLNFFKSNEP